MSLGQPGTHINIPDSNSGRHPALLEAQKALKLRAYTHGEATDHTIVGDEHVSTHCNITKTDADCSEEQPYTLRQKHCGVLSQCYCWWSEYCSKMPHCGNVMQCCCNIVATRFLLPRGAICSLWLLAVEARSLVFNGVAVGDPLSIADTTYHLVQTSLHLLHAHHMSLQTTSCSSHLSRFFTIPLTTIRMHKQTNRSNKTSNHCLKQRACYF